MNKKTLVALGAAMSVAFAGCSDKGPSSTAANTPSAPTQPAAKAESSPLPATAVPAASPTPARSGPAGLGMGMSIEELNQIVHAAPVPKTPMVYITTSVPSPLPGFERYFLIVSPKAGLCKVVALGEEIKGDSQGFAVRDSFEKVSEAITKKYGATSSTLDDLLPGSIWKEPQEWMMGLAKQERVLSSVWGGKGTGKSGLPNDIDTIGLKAEADSPYVARLNLSYEFNNFDSCREELKSATNAGF